MSGQRKALTVTFSEADAGRDCPWSKIEVVGTEELAKGAEVEIRLWSQDPGVLSRVRLFQGTRGLGHAAGASPPGDAEFEALAKFSGGNTARLEWPWSSLVSARASGDVLVRDGDSISVFRSSGAGMAYNVRREGGTCLAMRLPGEYYGAVKVRVRGANHFGKWTWTVSGPGVFWFFVRDGDRIVHEFELDIEESAATVGYRDMIIRVTELDSDIRVAGASVSVDGRMRGTTNENGELALSQVPYGDRTLRITHPDYLPSDEDELNNDHFRVE